MLSFPPLLCRKKYQTWNDEITKSHEIKSVSYTCMVQDTQSSLLRESGFFGNGK